MCPWGPPMAKAGKKRNFYLAFGVLELDICFYSQKYSPDKNTQKIFFRKFFFNFFGELEPKY